MADSSRSGVGRTVLVVLAVFGVLCAIYLAAVAVSYLMHSHHHHGPSHTVTVTTTG